eukprot:TRINITY_DN4270_c1_g1_i1.p1 TRINITY_DN4270_c1_g1~~TRINITY_DN4270_c1_g1_i1.p1  ORF type:complete len:224 (-),score=45.51 TRINITY_DN4270_c1_g1_i1:535-1206(-)
MTIQGLEKLPSVLQQSYSVMRNLDKSLQALQQQNEERCEKEIEDIRRGVKSGNIRPDASSIIFSNEALDEQKQCIGLADDKVSLAMQAYDVVDAHIQHLDQYMRGFDEEIRRERDLMGSAGMDSLNLDGMKSGRVGETTTKGGRRKTRLAVDQPSMDLDLPVDPNEPTYCFCNQVSYGEMVACDNPDCKIEWFHYGCVGLKEQPRGKWYCSNCVGMPKRRKGK